MPPEGHSEKDRSRLIDLLKKSFTNSELRRLLEGLPMGRATVNGLSKEKGSVDSFTSEVVEHLQRRNLLNQDFFDALRRERSERMEEIEKVARPFLVSESRPDAPCAGRDDDPHNDPSGRDTPSTLVPPPQTVPPEPVTPRPPPAPFPGEGSLKEKGHAQGGSSPFSTESPANGDGSTKHRRHDDTFGHTRPKFALVLDAKRLTIKVLIFIGIVAIAIESLPSLTVSMVEPTAEEQARREEEARRAAAEEQTRRAAAEEEARRKEEARRVAAEEEARRAAAVGAEADTPGRTNRRPPNRGKNPVIEDVPVDVDCSEDNRDCSGDSGPVPMNPDARAIARIESSTSLSELNRLVEQESKDRDGALLPGLVKAIDQEVAEHLLTRSGDLTPQLCVEVSRALRHANILRAGERQTINVTTCNRCRSVYGDAVDVCPGGESQEQGAAGNCTRGSLGGCYQYTRSP